MCIRDRPEIQKAMSSAKYKSDDAYRKRIMQAYEQHHAPKETMDGTRVSLSLG